MVAVFVVAHAPLASALVTVAAHVYPECADRVTAMDVPPDADPVSLEARLREMLGQRAGEECLLLTDAFGATPCNLAMKVADPPRVRVVTGVNVPMLWRTLCYADEPLERAVNRAVEGATQGVLQLSAPRRQNQGAPATSHDQVEHHHQQ